MVARERLTYPRRIYPLDTTHLREEQLAVVFAMTSRRPEPFDEIAQLVSEEKAADFHERWVLNYGHASVAEHAILHMAVENISRLACDTLEDNRLASYTEKSTRFQALDPDYYHVPKELSGHPLEEVFVSACDRLFDTYQKAVDGLKAYLPQEMPQKEGERDSAFNLRIRRTAIDSARFLLPAATLTNVGVTMNARSLEHAVRKLLSSDLEEEQEVGIELKERGREITPTLVKYAERNEYLVATRRAQRQSAWAGRNQDGNEAQVRLVHWDPQAQEKLTATLLYTFSDRPYNQLWEEVLGMDASQREGVVHQALERLGQHDIPVRELEAIDYTFDMVMDYGAYREFKRHRMQTYIPQPLTTALGYVVPPLVLRAGLTDQFHEAVQTAEKAFRQVGEVFPRQAEYLVTHAHNRRVLSKMNLRECYHLFKLRTQPQAHFTIREAAAKAMELAREVHPQLFKYLALRSE